MSQYPSPYTPPPTNYGGYNFDYYQPGQDPRAPARRASVMMFVIGALLALSGLCCGAMATVVPMDEIIAQNPMLSSTPGVTAEMMKVGMIVVGVLGLLFGVVMLILGYFVRGGGIVPIVISIVLVALAALFNLANLASTAFQMRGAPAELAGGVCINVIPFALLLTLLAMLVQAAKAASRVAQMNNQYQQQMWQYQQQQQMYQQAYAAQQQQQQQQQPPPMPGQLPPGRPPVPPPAPPDTGSPGDPDAPSA
jgi:hypothetical protein